MNQITNDDETKAQEILAEAFTARRFMEPFITDLQEWECFDGAPGTTYEPAGTSGEPANNSVERWSEGGVYVAGEYDYSVISGYGARMSAPGYLDCTEWAVFATQEQAAKYLADTHGDAEAGFTDADEEEAWGA